MEGIDIFLSRLIIVFSILISILFFDTVVLAQTTTINRTEPVITKDNFIAFQQDKFANDNEFEQVKRTGDFEVNVFESPKGRYYQIYEYVGENINVYQRDDTGKVIEFTYTADSICTSVRTC
jgi:hypothetical protein